MFFPVFELSRDDVLPPCRPLVVSPDQDGWSGEFSQGQEYPLLWKEGEVYLLPLAEDDLGYYRAPGETGEEGGKGG